HCQKHPSGTVPFEIQGDGSQTRAFNYISDAVDGIITIIEHGRHRETYHVGTNEELTIAEVARLLFGTLGREMTLVPGPMPEGQTLRRCPDITKVQQLGYTPKVPFEAGLKPTVDWYKAEVEQRLATPSV
ncbi:MAG: GDP-mannose 4,6-dehydratase, partial [Cyanobacteria bacterium HKST-UBA05]|nr:GDP-mannose 4,6-dehydratase [Cyanobacteria bacterium HKST-UBA05]